MKYVSILFTYTLFLTCSLQTSPIQYMAMNKQDEYMNTVIFKNKRNGFFIEIGAFNGITMSLSYAFEKFLNWKGICIEASPIPFRDLVKNRNCLCLNCAIGAQEKNTQFMYFPSLPTFSGMYDYVYPHSFNNLQSHSATPLKYELISIPVRTLMNIIKENNIQEIDLLTIDVEGAELDILRSIDFEHVNIKVICSECNHVEQRDFLQQKGYSLLASIKEDDIFIRNDFLDELSTKEN